MDQAVTVTNALLLVNSLGLLALVFNVGWWKGVTDTRLKHIEDAVHQLPCAAACVAQKGT